MWLVGWLVGSLEEIRLTVVNIDVELLLFVIQRTLLCEELHH